MAYSDELYQQVILDHNRHPRNFRVQEHPTHACEGRNPLCGDHIQVFLQVGADGTIADASFQGNGCAISKASASMMTAFVKGKRADEAREAAREFQALVTGELDPAAPHHLGKLTLFEGVKKYSSRVKCASLAWHALTGALDAQTTATTETPGPEA